MFESLGGREGEDFGKEKSEQTEGIEDFEGFIFLYNIKFIYFN